MTTLLTKAFFPFFAVVVAIQGVHVFEHIVQLIEVYAFGVPDDDALGLLGFVIQFNDTEEWLHLGFNSLYLLSLYALVYPLWRLVPGGVPRLAFVTFLVFGVWIESWHVVEHGVIIANVIRTDGCPCPGIGDRVLGVTDTQLHFVYNAVAYAATVTPFWFLMRARPLRPAWSEAAKAH